MDPPVAVDGHPVVGSGRSSPHSQKSTAWWASTSNGIPGETRAGPARGVGADLLGVGLAEHLHAAERELPVVGTEVPVVQGERLLETCRVGLLRHRHQRQVVVPHVVPADHARAVGKSVRMGVVAERSSSAAEFTAPQPRRRRRRRTAPPWRRVGFVAHLRDDRGDRPPDGSVSSRCTQGRGEQLHARVLERRSTHTTCASDLAPTRQGKPSTRSQRMHRLARVARPASSCTRSTPMGRWNGAAPASPGRRRAAGSVARAAPAGGGTAARPHPPSGPPRAGRARGRDARPARSTARGRRSRSARQATSRRGGAVLRSPPVAAGTGPRRRTSCSPT